MDDLNIPIYSVENYTFDGSPENTITSTFPPDRHIKDVEIEFKKSGNSVVTLQAILLVHDHKHTCILLLKTPNGFNL